MAQYAFIMLIAGVGIPILAALNAALGTRISSPAAAAAIDHFGLFGAQVSPLGMARASGIALEAAGVWLTQQV